MIFFATTQLLKNDSLRRGPTAPPRSLRLTRTRCIIILVMKIVSIYIVVGVVDDAVLAVFVVVDVVVVAMDVGTL